MKKILLIALILGSTISCEDFEGWNIDEKNPSEVPAAFLFTNAQRAFFRQMTIPSVNSNITKQLAQHWTTTTYNDETNYDMVQRDIGGNWWFSMYVGVMIDVVEAKKIIAEKEANPGVAANKIAILDLFQSFVWQVVVDTYGDAPYSEALLGNENLIPKYDDDAAIYADVMRTIDVALNALNESNGSFGGEDLIYGGSVASWRKFGNTLKFKMAVRMADADPAAAKTAAEQAMSGVLESNADNAEFPFETAPPNTNPNWEALVQSGRNDYVIANTFADIMNTLNDPRSAVFMDDNQGIPYKGGIYGASNTYSEYTWVGTQIKQPDHPAVIMSYDEVNFLMAEAVEKGLISGDAESYYNEGIKASMYYWSDLVGLGLDDAAIDGYIAQPTVAYNAAEWNKSIGQQKWIALYGRGFEAWCSWRLLDWPEMNIAAVSQESVPRRYIYPNDEPQVNGTNYEAAKTAMGGDLKSNRVFWDINGQGN